MILGEENSYKELSLGELEMKQEGVERRLKELAQFTPRTGVGGIGCRSFIYPEAEHAVWMKIDLDGVAVIDQIVLVPVLQRDPDRGFLAEGFPEYFRIRVGLPGDELGKVVAEFEGDEGILPRVAPLIIPVKDEKVGWVKIEVDRLPLWERTGEFVFQLSEVLVLRGEENLALRQRVSKSEEVADLNAWRDEFLTDGLLPYIMNVPRRQGTVASTSGLLREGDPSAEITVDLEESRLVSGFHLHAVEQNDTAPQSFAGAFGIPEKFRLEGSNSIDFSEKTELLNVEFDSVYKKGPTLMWRFPEVQCRFVRLTALEPFKANELVAKGSRIGFAEIEVMVEGQDVALGKKVSGNFPLSHHEQSFERYTDGLNIYGVILPLRQWIGELAERHRLEIELPLLEIELGKRYASQKKYLQLAGWLVAGLGGGICLLFIYGNMLRIRQATRIRERIAANLHDELGANLHAIGLLGDMARRLAKSPEGLNETLDRIRGLTERTGTAAKHCANMMAAEGVCEDLVAEMQRDTVRLLADLEHDFEIIGKERVNGLSRRRRIDLMLFYKECLINVIRHSGATRVVTRLAADDGGLWLTVDDNGKGYDGGVAPKALKRRAQLMGATMVVEKSELGGIRILLKKRNRIFNFL